MSLVFDTELLLTVIEKINLLKNKIEINTKYVFNYHSAM